MVGAPAGQVPGWVRKIFRFRALAFLGDGPLTVLRTRRVDLPDRVFDGDRQRKKLFSRNGAGSRRNQCVGLHHAFDGDDRAVDCLREKVFVEFKDDDPRAEE